MSALERFHCKLFIYRSFTNNVNAHKIIVFITLLTLSETPCVLSYNKFWKELQFQVSENQVDTKELDFNLFVSCNQELCQTLSSFVRYSLRIGLAGRKYAVAIPSENWVKEKVQYSSQSVETCLKIIGQPSWVLRNCVYCWIGTGICLLGITSLTFDARSPYKEYMVSFLLR